MYYNIPFLEGIFFRISANRFSTSFSVSSFLAKCRRIRWLTGSLKKLEPGTARNCTQCRQVPDSNAFVPSVVGLIIAGEVIKDLTQYGSCKVWFILIIPQTRVGPRCACPVFVIPKHSLSEIPIYITAPAEKQTLPFHKSRHMKWLSELPFSCEATQAIGSWNFWDIGVFQVFSRRICVVTSDGNLRGYNKEFFLRGIYVISHWRRTCFGGFWIRKYSDPRPIYNLQNRHILL